MLSLSQFLKLFMLMLCYTFMTAATYAVEVIPETIKADMMNPGYHEKPSWFKESFLDLSEDITEATENKKRVLLYFYQDGCPYCAKLLQDNFGQKKIADKTKNNFDVIAINMWGDKEVTDLAGKVITEKKFAEKLRIMYTPTLLFLTEQGKVALRVNGYYAPRKFETALDYIRGHNETKISFRDYYNKYAPAAVSGKLHSQPFILKPPYNLKTLLKKDKLLLILFEQKKCKDCDELHKDIFKRKETIEEVNKFNVVRLDMWSNEKLVNFKGSVVSAKELAKKMNINNAPSFVFLNNKGKEVFRIDAYLKSFHTQSVMDYISSGAYKTQASFQRFIAVRAEKLEAQGVHVDLMN